ncbi:MAG: hypothetical protein GC192_23560 [Bacteroidetes bacterium]|nr:hypothetical protein [Bacteroidota bacterium]
MIFYWDIKEWIQKNVGSRKRKDALLSYIYIFIKPIENLHLDFIDFTDDLSSKIRYSSQQKVLASFLNRKFDEAYNRIRVETDSDGRKNEPVWFRQEPFKSSPTYFRQEGETNKPVYFRQEIPRGKFIVYVPSELSDFVDEIKGWIDRYTEASKTYSIVYI